MNILFSEWLDRNNIHNIYHKNKEGYDKYCGDGCDAWNYWEADLQDYFHDGFSWERTPEGFTYWEKINKKRGNNIS